jgi:O-antigen/teichoic acid export membrane protein
LGHLQSLGGQTLWYGVSSLLARFLNYLLTPYLTAVLLQADYGEMSIVYAAIPFAAVIFMFGLETAYFRFATVDNDEQKAYTTATVVLFTLIAVFFLTLSVFSRQLAVFIHIPEHPEYIILCACIVALDAIGSLAFARLRFYSQPKKFAVIRTIGVLVNIFFTVFFLSICPWLIQKNPDSFFLRWYNSEAGIAYIFVANILQSAICLLLLRKELKVSKMQFDTGLARKMLWYCLPLVVIGLCTAINEMAGRLMLNWWLPADNTQVVKEQVATYSACSKLAAVITIAVFAFRLGAEPFFFRESGNANHKLVYAKVFNFFVIVAGAIFLVVSLNLGVLKYFIQNPAMWEGLKLVPVLLFANIFMGINYNLSIWYKLKNFTLAGAVISITGCLVTVLFNWLFIPRWGYIASAWATMACYATMVLVTYTWGRKVYPIPYNILKAAGYLLLALGLYSTCRLLNFFGVGGLLLLFAGVVLILCYLLVVLRIETDKISYSAVLKKKSRYYKWLRSWADVQGYESFPGRH